MLNSRDFGAAVPLDLASFVACKAGDPERPLEWPIAYADYAFLSGDFVDRICSAARAAASTPELEAVVEAKLYDTITDLSVVARLALELRKLRETGRRPVYDTAGSAWLEFLDNGEGDAGRLFARARWHFETYQGVVATAKRFGRRWHSDLTARLTATTGRHDILSRNGLLDQYFDRTRARGVNISPNYRDWPAPPATPEPVRDLVAAMADAFMNAASPATGNDKDLSRAACALAGPVIAGHIGKAWSDLERIRNLVTSSRAGDILAGGTPKHIGRLFAWHYQQLGREVVRFAHGGERAFYDDYAWSLAELPSCNRYFCHSRAEASHLERRRDERRMVPAGVRDLAFEGLGSARHQEIRKRQHTERKRDRNGTVMYVAGGYLGETLGDFPSRKPPDALYFEWQTWLLSALRAPGRRIVTKVHPKGVYNEAMVLRDYCDEIVGGIFNPESHDADCYIFDFAGTAFFDALASGRGVVLVDTGVRPRDVHSFSDLGLRCEIVDCTVADGNRFRADRQHLDEAVECASHRHEWPDSFFDSYFHG